MTSAARIEESYPAESAAQGLIGATVEEMDPAKRRLPLPSDEGRQIFKGTAPPRRGSRRWTARSHEEWVLKVPDLELRRVVAWYYVGQRILKRQITSRQTYANKPGIAWNLELLQRAEHWHRRPLKLVVIFDEPRLDGSPRQPYVVTWEVVRAFAHAALEGDDRWLIEDDVDTQLLIPWPAWAGTWTEPPPPRDPETDPIVETAALFEMPADPLPPKPPRQFV